jgi:hypothetical protein
MFRDPAVCFEHNTFALEQRVLAPHRRRGCAPLAAKSTEAPV